MNSLCGFKLRSQKLPHIFDLTLLTLFLYIFLRFIVVDIGIHIRHYSLELTTRRKSM